MGMGKDFFDNSPEARQAFEEIDRIAGRSLSTLCFAGPDEELRRTINTQPTILAVSLAAWKAYEAAGGPKPEFTAGHSLGEFTALVAAGALSVDAAVKLVDKRSRLMETCPRGAMSAVIGIAGDELSKLCQEASDETTSMNNLPVCLVANYNTREQLVISGSPEAVTVAGDKAKKAGARVVPLPVGGAFHSPLMEAAAVEFESELADYQFADAVCEVVQNFDAKPARAAQELQSKLAQQMPNAVRWCDTIEFMLSQGVDTFVEIGPGKALAGMVKKIHRQATVHNILDGPSLNETIAALRPVLT
jgi:[acyl-carrier-protein] S-malonyltransferase